MFAISPPPPPSMPLSPTLVFSASVSCCSALFAITHSQPHPPNAPSPVHAPFSYHCLVNLYKMLSVNVCYHPLPAPPVHAPFSHPCLVYLYKMLSVNVCYQPWGSGHACLHYLANNSGWSPHNNGCIKH